MNEASQSSSLSEDLDLAERYLIQAMFEKAESLSSSILRRCFSDREQFENGTVESASMVFLQSLNEHGKTDGIFNKLELLFESVAVIPADVLILGAHLQIEHGSGTTTKLRSVLEQFLKAWRFVDGVYDGQTYVSLKTEEQHFSLLSVEKYLEIVDVYVIRLLGTILCDFDAAISWTENADLPEEKRRELIRKLQSLSSAKDTSSSQAFIRENGSPSKEEKEEFRDRSKQSHSSIRKAFQPCFWVFQTFGLKSGNAPLIFQNEKLFILTAFVILICYFARKKHATIQRFALKQFLSVRKALIDIWQLAFSIPVNSLAAV
ncbi:hypothetical protein ZOSMA_144G00190 [Zostera marina]|uniref:3-phosphoinositide-dependent protein kinase-1 n=1 Tax=Zostera marina TaxID=29655 RepID=A0A0K9PX91_ZOSMR|nr:hypothetical protein ZOSMA_144G00190 [Zostera marina]